MTNCAQLKQQFVNSLLDTQQFDIEITKNLGATINQITTGAFKQMVFYMPATKPEQTAIGNFFRTLDDNITLYKRKLDGLKELKCGYLQHMFPQEGENLPRLRFNGFTEPWERRKLGDVFEQTVKLVNPKENGIELWSLTVENGLTPKTERYNREFLVKNDNLFKAVVPNEFVYNPMNMTLGAVDLNLLNKEVAVSGYYITMRTNDDCNNNYFAVWLKSPSAIELYKTYATGGLIEKQRIQFPTLSQIATLVPSKTEQTAIGNFFQNLVEQVTAQQVTAQQAKLDRLKQLKAAYLQKMFV